MNYLISTTMGIGIVFALCAMFVLGISIMNQIDCDEFKAQLNGVGIERIDHHEIKKNDVVVSNWYEIVWKDDANRENAK